MTPVPDMLPKDRTTEHDEQPLTLRSLTIADLGGLTEELIGNDRAFWSHVLLATARDRWLRRLLPGQQPVPLLFSARCNGVIHGLVMALPDNRSGSCWSLHKLCLAEPLPRQSRRTAALALVRHVIAVAPKARCWFARCWSTDPLRLPLLREAGFQPLLQQSIWRLNPASTANWPQTTAAPAGYRRLLWERSQAPALLHLENATTPTQLRHLLDSSSNDLGRATMGGVLLESARGGLAAALRLVRRHPRLPPRLSILVHPGHEHLYGPPLQAELVRLLDLAPRLGPPMDTRSWRLRCNQGESRRQQWFTTLGLDCLGDEMLLARSIWRRQVRSTRNRLSHWLREAPRQLAPRGRPIPDMSGDTSDPLSNLRRFH
ncbi:MAG: hypothetical protein F4X84_04330 [Synechococcus sp. SB0662_bin_45]|nr:hypothetical protein [Synechococcus sp. SB0668_bin_13]MYE21592.1 hypothetical protein [Synechococcus sp. SB0662_bin_45]